MQLPGVVFAELAVYQFPHLLPGISQGLEKVLAIRIISENVLLAWGFGGEWSGSGLGFTQTSHLVCVHSETLETCTNQLRT